MQEVTLAGVMLRMKRLERENRIWKGIGSAVLICLAVVALLGATRAIAPDEIRARRFVLLDDSGMERGTFGFTSSGAVSLSLRGVPRPDGSPKGVASIEIREDGAAGLVFTGGKGLALLSTDQNGSTDLFLTGVRPAVQLRGQYRSTGIKLEVSSENIPRLQLVDSKSTTRAVVGSVALRSPQTGIMEQRPASSIILFDEQGHVIWRAP